MTGQACDMGPLRGVIPVRPTADCSHANVIASRTKSTKIGGAPLQGHRVDNRKYLSPMSAEHIRWIFFRFLEIGSGAELAREVISITTALNRRFHSESYPYYAARETRSTAIDRHLT